MLKLDTRAEPRQRRGRYWSGWLQQQFPQPRPSRLSARALGLAVLAGVAGVALLLLQDRGAPPLDSIWNEDGRIFLGQALEFPAATSIARPYNGYLHLYPRLLAEVATALPIGWAAAFFAVAGDATTVAVALLTYVASGAYLRSGAVRLALAAALVVHPAAVTETYHTISMQHWFLAYAGLWLLLWRPEQPAAVALSTAVTVLAVLSGPIPLLLVPLAIARLVAVRAWRDRIVPIVCLVTAAAQLAVLVPFMSARPGGNVPVELPAIYGQRVLTAGVLGEVVTAALWPVLGWALPLTVLVVVALVIGGWLVRRGARFRPLAAVLLALSPASFVLMAAARGRGLEMLFGEQATWAHNRFTIVPILLLFVVFALVSDHLRAGAVVALLAVAFLGAGNLAQPYRPVGPTWSAEVERGWVVCAEQPVQQVRLVTLPPWRDPRRPHWSLWVNCDRLAAPQLR